jgi:hypothetical protein
MRVERSSWWSERTRAEMPGRHGTGPASSSPRPGRNEDEFRPRLPGTARAGSRRVMWRPFRGRLSVEGLLTTPSPEERRRPTCVSSAGDRRAPPGSCPRRADPRSTLARATARSSPPTSCARRWSSRLRHGRRLLMEHRLGDWKRPLRARPRDPAARPPRSGAPAVKPSARASVAKEHRSSPRAGGRGDPSSTGRLASPADHIRALVERADPRLPRAPTRSPGRCRDTRT